jgi:hypothetical protein
VDDGEPGGTAGRPMLDVLRHQDLEGVLATVVRYFGGVKLGAGGLVRAYTDSVAQALLQAEKVPLVRTRSLRCSVPYALEGLLRREIAAAGAPLLDVAHAALVTLQWSLPEPEAEALWRASMTCARGAPAGWTRNRAQESGHSVDRQGIVLFCMPTMHIALSSAIVNTATSMSNQQTAQAVQVSVLKKAMNADEAAVTTLLDGVQPAAPQLATSGTLGTQLNTYA